MEGQEETTGSRYYTRGSIDCSGNQSSIRPRRTSLIENKGTLSVDVRHLRFLPSSPLRPASSPVETQVDTRFHLQESPATTKIGMLSPSGFSRIACKTPKVTSDSTTVLKPTRSPTNQIGTMADKQPSNLVTTSDYRPSCYGGGDMSGSGNGAQGRKGGKGRWLNKAKDWFRTKENSRRELETIQKGGFKEARYRSQRRGC